jgi:hypothetical protein
MISPPLSVMISPPLSVIGALAKADDLQRASAGRCITRAGRQRLRSTEVVARAQRRSAVYDMVTNGVAAAVDVRSV